MIQNAEKHKLIDIMHTIHSLLCTLQKQNNLILHMFLTFNQIKTKNKQFIFLLVVLLFSACSPKVVTNIQHSTEPLAYTEKVKVVPLEKPMPNNAKIIGEIKIGDTGFSTNCTWEVVIQKAKEEARKAGGNAIKITEHIPPSVWGSSCHRIRGTIIYAENLSHDDTEDIEPITDDNFAILNVYRHRGPGTLVNYDLHLGDSTICRVSNNFKATIKVQKEGLNTLWAKTESKAELPIDIEMGHTYYLRCGIRMGFLVGKPSIQLVDYKSGKIEFDSIKQ